jgi:hypothetical protein
MIDLSKEEIEISCDCGAVHKATLQDVINTKTIRCRCGSSIKLNDKDGSVHKSVNDMNKTFKELEDTFKSLGG